MHTFLKLLFIRHAQSTGNQEKRMQGHGEFELSDVGRQQAEKLGKRLLAENWFPSRVYTSPLRRTSQTANILVNILQTAPLPSAVSDLIGDDDSSSMDDRPRKPIAIEYAEELKEFQNGIFKGLTWAEATARYPELCRSLESSPDWIPIPEAENLEDARARSQRFIERVLHRHKNGERVWVITHSWILQHLMAELLSSDRSWRIRAQNTALFEFWIDRERWERTDQNRFNTDLWQIHRFNDTQHLSDGRG